MYCVLHQGVRKVASPPVGPGGEEWRPVHFDPTYEVSSLGRVRSLRQSPSGRPLRVVADPNGLTIVDIGGSYRDGLSTSKTQSVARLVLHAFQGEPPAADLKGRWIANHRDGNTANNRVENLEWTQQREARHPRSRHSAR
jgi:hypothetical protein